MKKIQLILKNILLLSLFVLCGCVHDDVYETPNLSSNQCENETYFTNASNGFVKWTLKDLKARTINQIISENAYVEGYVSSTDETGNIYKYLYLQDAPANPTEGLIITLDAVNTYTLYPQGSKVFVKLKGLSIGTYGGFRQLGYLEGNAFGRIPEKMISSTIIRACGEKANLVPKEMTLAEMRTANDQFLGCLIKVPNAEFDAKILCSQFAPNGENADKQINDPTTSVTTRVVRNSGYASFANQILPSGKGDCVGILSKFNSTYQIYLNKFSDVSGMTNFPRKDGITADPCGFSFQGLTLKTIAEIKQLYTTGNFVQITQDFYIKVKVTANDETGNLFKYIYVEDASGGIRVNINKQNLFQDQKFKVGKIINIKLKNLYLGTSLGELQIGQPFNNNIGQIAENEIYKFFFDTKEPIKDVVPTEKTISQLTTSDVGRWIRIKDLQFIESDLGKKFASGATTNRTLEDCSGNKIILRTSNFASFANNLLDNGKGDVSAILSIANGIYQLWIPRQANADLDFSRCDGTLPVYQTLFTDGFTNLQNWTIVNVSGTQQWTTTNYGNPAPSAIMDGARSVNEDWLISKNIAIPTGLKEVFFTFETDGRFTGLPLEVYVTSNYTGNVSTTSWIRKTAVIDTDLNAYAGFVNSGKIDLSEFKGKNVFIAFKYVSVQGSSTTWELDNVEVKGVQ